MSKTTSYQYFTANEIENIAALIKSLNFSQAHRILVKHPFFQFYNSEIIHMGLEYFYSQNSIQQIIPNQVVQLIDNSAIVLGGHLHTRDAIFGDNDWKDFISWQEQNQTLIQLDESTLYMFMLKKSLQDQLTSLVFLKNQNQQLAFLSSLYFLQNYFLCFKSIEPDNVYMDYSRLFRVLLGAHSVQTYQTRALTYKENDRSIYLFIIEKGDIELSTQVSFLTNPSVKDVIDQEIIQTNDKLKIQLNSKHFEQFKQRIQIEILSQNQFYGESEFIDRNRRITRACCLSPNTIVHRLNLSKFDFTDKVNKQILYALQTSYNQKKQWINDRITTCIKAHVAKKAQILLKDKIKQVEEVSAIKNKKKSQQIDRIELVEEEQDIPYIYQESPVTKKVDFIEFAQFQPQLHPNTSNLNELEKAKTKIFKKICRDNFEMSFNLLDTFTSKKQSGRFTNLKAATFIASKQSSDDIKTKTKQIREGDLKLQNITTKRFSSFQSRVTNTFNLISELNNHESLVEVSTHYPSLAQPQYQQIRLKVLSPYNLSPQKNNMNIYNNLMIDQGSQRLINSERSNDHYRPVVKSIINRIHSRDTDRYFIGGPKLPITNCKRNLQLNKTTEDISLIQPLTIQLQAVSKQFS